LLLQKGSSMNFLTKMSIAQKLFLIPIIGTVGFLLYLGITTLTGLRNVELLDDIIEVQYPALDATNSALVKIEKVRDTLSSAAITGDEDALDAAKTIANDTEALLKKIQSINPNLADEANRILESCDPQF
jgi:methyl-accepting chemotaxis protein